jgi:uncharacterized Tic20 family protein
MSTALADPNPRITRVLPAIGTQAQPARADPIGRPRCTFRLQGQQPLQVWDDRVVAAGQTYRLDERFGLRVNTDPRAPLTVEPPFALSLLARDGRWDLYIPADEADLWPAVFAIQEACRLRGVEPVGLSDEGGGAPSWGRVEASRAPQYTQRPFVTPRTTPRPARSLDGQAAKPLVTPIWRPRSATPRAAMAEVAALHTPDVGERTAEYTPSDSLLAAIAHLSVLFLPVLLPTTIWLSLRGAEPHVARHAREAAIFQSGFAVLAIVALGDAFVAALTHGFGAGAWAGLIAFVALLALAGGCAFFAAARALRGQDFSYLGWSR